MTAKRASAARKCTYAVKAYPRGGYVYVSRCTRNVKEHRDGDIGLCSTHAAMYDRDERVDGVERVTARYREMAASWGPS